MFGVETSVCKTTFLYILKVEEKVDGTPGEGCASFIGA